MSLNYDADKRTVLSEAMQRAAMESRLAIVHFICAEPNAKVDDPTGVSFFALTPSVPRVGERIELQDGKKCDVRAVLYKVVSDGEVIQLVANVVAVWVQR